MATHRHTFQTLFLPLTKQQACAFEAVPSTISQLDAYGRAAVIVLLAFGRKEGAELVAAEKMLAELIPMMSDLTDAELSQVVDQFKGAQDIFELSTKAMGLGFRFMPSADLATKPFLKMGAWDWDFQASYSSPFSEREIRGKRVRASLEQHQILTAVIAEPQEDMTIDGFAGTGKTHLIAYLGEHCPGRFTFVAPRDPQLDALLARFGHGGLRHISLHGLGEHMAEVYSVREGENIYYDPNPYMTPAAIAAHLSISSVAGFSSIKVVDICTKAVIRFCQSIDAVILDTHFFRSVSFALGDADRAALRAYATTLWEFTIHQPDPKLRVPRRAFHVVKYLDLREQVIPKWCGSLIVDEAHDISAPWRQIFARGGGGVITLGDRYQRLQSGRGQGSIRGRQRSLVRSIRVGDSASPLMNEVLRTHPDTPPQEFVGSRERNTNIRNYEGESLAFVREGLVLFADVWSLLDNLRRLADGGARFRLLDASVRNVELVVSDLADLHERRLRPSFFSLSKFGSWNEFTNAQASDRRVRRVVDFIEGGYTGASLRADLAKQSPPGADGLITLGFAADGKNIEQNVVILAPDMFPDNVADKGQAANMVSSIYLALSRARYELWVPGHARDWLTDVRRVSLRDERGRRRQ